MGIAWGGPGTAPTTKLSPHSASKRELLWNPTPAIGITETIPSCRGHDGRFGNARNFRSSPLQ